MDVTSVCEKSTREYLKGQHLEDSTVEDNNTIKEVFPWLPKFSKLICSSVGSRNHQLLERSLLLYTQNILSSIGASNVKSSDTINLKNHISNMLIFFHLYWLDIKQDIADHSSYLNKMSTLLNVYIDMELKTSMEKKTSSHVKDSSKIAAKLLAALYIYLNNSEEHIFRVLLRIKHATKKYTKVCDYIFTKSFTNLTTKITSITDVAYVRYLLAFKMWKKMEENSDKKERINKLALTLLGPRMPKLRDELLEFIPKPLTEQENETLWLLQSNVFDLKQVHKRFLLLENKIDLQCTKLLHTAQNYSKSQKHQMNPVCHQSNSNAELINREINKDHLSNSQSHKLISSINENRSIDQTYLIKKGTKGLKPLKKLRKKAGKTIIIDLTGDDETSAPYKMKRKKKSKRDLEWLRIMKTKHKLQKHINSLKYSNLPKFIDSNTQENSNKNSKSSIDKILLECKPISENKVSDSTECCTLTNSRFSLNDTYHINLPRNEHLNMTRNQMNNFYPDFGKEDEMQHDDSLHNLKPSKFVNQDIKEFKFMTNIPKENKSENSVSSHMTYVTGNAANLYNNPIMQSKEILTSQEESAMETIPLFKVCQDSIADQHSLKQELPTSTNCNAMQNSHKCCETVPVDVDDINRLIIKKLKSINDHSSQITEIIKQKVCQANECTNCCMKIDCKPFVLANSDITTTKTQDNLHNTFNDNGNDVKSACDTNIIYMLSDRNKCVYVVNHIDERIMTVHAEKRMQCLDKSNDVCSVSTTFTGDQVVESSLDSQHTNFVNSRVNDYGNDTKYSEITMKEQQKSNCDTLISNDRIRSSEPCIFNLNSFEIGSNGEVDYESQLKNFPKTEEANEIMKTDCIDDLENISFLHNIQGETLEDFLQQPSMMSQINYDGSIGASIKKPLICNDNDVIEIKTQNTLHNIFNDNENDVNSACDTNVIYTLSGRNKYVYVTNRIDERVMTMNAEKRIHSLDKPDDMRTISTTFIGNQVVESPLDSQHVNFDNLRVNDYGDVSKYSEITMKEQPRRNNCDTSISNDWIHSSEPCIFDINSFEINTKEVDYESQLRNFPKLEEVNEIMKTGGIDDIENISFIHNLQSETLEDFLRVDCHMYQIRQKSPTEEASEKRKRKQLQFWRLTKSSISINQHGAQTEVLLAVVKEFVCKSREDNAIA